MIAMICYHTILHGEVITDGSLSRGVIELTGPNYEIQTGLGQQQGGNLFHSFSTFNLLTGEQAHFRSENNTHNIVARITGGEASSINGSINSEVALWMINPAGWVFGTNAEIHVNSAFHISTADSVHFENNSHFWSNLNQQSKLTIDQPLGVTFLQPQASRITINNSTLKLPNQSTLSMIANHIEIDNASIMIPDGQILIGATNSPGNWSITEQGLESGSTSSFGKIDIVNDKFTHDFNTGTLSAIPVLVIFP